MAAKNSNGCTGPGCTSSDTVTVDGIHGRRCGNCPPTYSAKHMSRIPVDWDAAPYGRTVASLPPGGYRRELTDHMLDLGRADAAFAYLDGWLRAEINRRFTAALGTLR